MKLLSLTLILINLQVQLYTEDSLVIQLESLDELKDFIAELQEDEQIMIELQAPWCGHCKTLAPEQEKAATTLAKQDIQVVAVDCTLETTASLKKFMDLKGFPSVFEYRNKGAFDIDNFNKQSGQRSSTAIVSRMLRLNNVSDVNIDDIDKTDQTEAENHPYFKKIKENMDTISDSVKRKIRMKRLEKAVGEQKENGLFSTLFKSIKEKRENDDL